FRRSGPVRPTRYRHALPPKILVALVGKFGPRRRIVSRLRDTLARFRPSLARPIRGFAQHDRALLDDHFGFIGQAHLRENRLGNDDSVGISHATDGDLHGGAWVHGWK